MGALTRKFCGQPIIHEQKTGIETLCPVQCIKHIQRSPTLGFKTGSLNSPQRRGESAVLRQCWAQLGFPLVADLPRLSPSARLEGGDFFPLAPRLSLIGVGLRTNLEAVQLLVCQIAITSSTAPAKCEARPRGLFMSILRQA